MHPYLNLKRLLPAQIGISHLHLGVLLAFCLLSQSLVSCHPYQHRAVLENEANEAFLPYHLKNNVHRSPRVQEILALSSWFHPGEMPVFEREADRISRQAIYRVLTHAGFIPRRFFYR